MSMNCEQPWLFPCLSAFVLPPTLSPFYIGSSFPAMGLHSSSFRHSREIRLFFLDFGLLAPTLFSTPLTVFIRLTLLSTFLNQPFSKELSLFWVSSLT